VTRISDPTQVDHADLRELAVQAAWVAKLEDAVGALEELVVDLVDEDRPADVKVWDENPLEVALSVVHANFEAADQELEARVTEWLAQDPEHWPIFRLVVLDPWQEQPGQWREDVPGLVAGRSSSWNRRPNSVFSNSVRISRISSSRRRSSFGLADMTRMMGVSRSGREMAASSSSSSSSAGPRVRFIGNIYLRCAPTNEPHGRVSLILYAYRSYFSNTILTRS